MISVEQKKLVKAKGFLANNDGVHFSARIITENGVLNTKQMKTVCDIADKFGNGNIFFTSRMTVELPHIKFEDIEKVISYAKNAGLEIGGTGAKVRPIMCCKGTVCVFGTIDTQGITTQLHKRFFEGYGAVALPHKFKIAVGGCINNCVKPNLNDLGIVGHRVKDGEAKRCRIYIGGRWGRQFRHGSQLGDTFLVEEAMDIVEKAILYFKAHAYKSERFACMIDRIGLEKVSSEILNFDIERKQEIIASEIQTRT